VERHAPGALAATGASRLAVALSGGADSLALALGVGWATRRAGPVHGVAARCHVVDHGLQPGSDEVAERAAAVVAERGLAARVTRVHVDVAGQGVEAAARDARYAALLADPDDLVLTGHTLDDQAETVLLGLARGSGTRSLAGMPVLAGRVLRPLLGLRRSQTEQACRDWGVTPWQDPMNDDERFARVRARRALGQLEADLGPGLTEALARTAELAGSDADYLDGLAEAARRDVAIGSGLGAARLKTLPEALRGRVVLAWLRERGVADIGLAHVRAVVALAVDHHGQGGVAVPGGRVERRDGRIMFDRGQ
jgi:tRNA(Ile)-lysidine synthase